MILVVGATGSLGGRITRGLLAHQDPISAQLAQQGRANTAASLVAAGAQAVYADLKYPASLTAALAGVDTTEMELGDLGSIDIDLIAPLGCE